MVAVLCFIVCVSTMYGLFIINERFGDDVAYSYTMEKELGLHSNSKMTVNHQVL